MLDSELIVREKFNGSYVQFSLDPDYQAFQMNSITDGRLFLKKKIKGEYYVFASYRRRNGAWERSSVSPSGIDIFCEDTFGSETLEYKAFELLK